MSAVQEVRSGYHIANLPVHGIAAPDHDHPVRIRVRRFPQQSTAHESGRHSHQRNRRRDNHERYDREPWCAQQRSSHEARIHRPGRPWPETRPELRHRQSLERDVTTTSFPAPGIDAFSHHALREILRDTQPERRHTARCGSGVCGEYRIAERRLHGIAELRRKVGGYAPSSMR
jgi:hypothetical protein